MRVREGGEGERSGRGSKNCCLSPSFRVQTTTQKTHSPPAPPWLQPPGRLAAAACCCCRRHRRARRSRCAATPHTAGARPTLRVHPSNQHERVMMPPGPGQTQQPWWSRWWTRRTTRPGARPGQRRGAWGQGRRGRVRGKARSAARWRLPVAAARRGPDESKTLSLCLCVCLASAAFFSPTLLTYFCLLPAPHAFLCRQPPQYSRNGSLLPGEWLAGVTAGGRLARLPGRRARLRPQNRARARAVVEPHARACPPAPTPARRCMAGTHTCAHELGVGELAASPWRADTGPHRTVARARLRFAPGPAPCAAAHPRISWHARLGASAGSVDGCWRRLHQLRGWGRAVGEGGSARACKRPFFEPAATRRQPPGAASLPLSAPSPGEGTARASAQPVALTSFPSSLFPRRSCSSRSPSPRRRAPSTRRPSSRRPT